MNKSKFIIFTDGEADHIKEISLAGQAIFAPNKPLTESLPFSYNDFSRSSKKGFEIASNSKFENLKFNLQEQF